MKEELKVDLAFAIYKLDQKIRHTPENIAELQELRYSKNILEDTISLLNNILYKLQES